MFPPRGFAFATLFRLNNSTSPMPQFRAVFALLWSMAFTVPVVFAQTAPATKGDKAEKSPVFVRDVKFAQTPLGGRSISRTGCWSKSCRETTRTPRR